MCHCHCHSSQTSHAQQSHALGFTWMPEGFSPLRQLRLPRGSHLSSLGHTALCTRRLSGRGFGHSVAYADDDYDCRTDVFFFFTAYCRTASPLRPPAVGNVPVPPPSLSTCVKFCVATHHIFLMSTGVDVGTDLVASWRRGLQAPDQGLCHLLHYSCARDLDTSSSDMVPSSTLQRRSNTASFTSSPAGPASARWVAQRSNSRTRTLRWPLGLLSRPSIALIIAWVYDGCFRKTSAAKQRMVHHQYGPSKTHVFLPSIRTCAESHSSVVSSRTLQQVGLAVGRTYEHDKFRFSCLHRLARLDSATRYLEILQPLAEAMPLLPSTFFTANERSSRREHLPHGSSVHPW